MLSILQLLLFQLLDLILAQQPQYAQCGGDDYYGSSICDAGLKCYKKNRWYSQCNNNCPDINWACSSTSSFIITGSTSDAVAEYGQCGGKAYAGLTTCANGLKCFKKHEYYSQCLKICPTGWQCLFGVAVIVTPAAPTEISSKELTVTASSISTDRFPNCQFRFGMGFNGASKNYSAGDYITIWIGSPSTTHGTSFNPYWHGEMLKTALKYNKMTVFYGYIIAFMARDEAGLKDCNIGKPNLCQYGSNYIRKNKGRIVSKYKHYAIEAAKIIGKYAEIIWLIEPDFWQYYGDTRQKGGPLNGNYMRQFFDEIVNSIKSEMPNSRISWNISPWISETDMRIWWGFFASSKNIDFVHTSGGESRADIGKIKENGLQWTFVRKLTGKKIIADTGYGVGGAVIGHNDHYDNLNNLKNRIKDGVIAVSQANFKDEWATILNNIRPKLKLC